MKIIITLHAAVIIYSVNWLLYTSDAQRTSGRGTAIHLMRFGWTRNVFAGTEFGIFSRGNNPEYTYLLCDFSNTPVWKIKNTTLRTHTHTQTHRRIRIVYGFRRFSSARRKNALNLMFIFLRENKKTTRRLIIVIVRASTLFFRRCVTADARLTLHEYEFTIRITAAILQRDTTSANT